jgi:hypothetical protein
MKTNPAARRLMKTRIIVLCTVLAAIGGLEFYLGASFVGRMGQTTASQTDSPAAPSMHLGALVDGGR